MSWEAGGPVLRVNTLQLDREELLRWDECRVAATEYLRAQPERFDFAPIIERSMAGVRTFYRWFWEQVNERSSEVVAELNAKAMEVSALVERTRLAIRLAFRRRRHTTLRLEWSSRTRKAATTPIPTWVARFRISVIDAVGAESSHPWPGLVVLSPTSCLRPESAGSDNHGTWRYLAGEANPAEMITRRVA